LISSIGTILGTTYFFIERLTSTLISPRVSPLTLPFFNQSIF
jgi:hypothetical protein